MVVPASTYSEYRAFWVICPKDCSNNCDIWQVWVLQEFGKFGAKTELVDVGTQTLSDGSVIPLPPILLGTLGNDPQKKTLLVYGHMDVQPALKV